jgi:protein-disulfide isomerase
MRSLLLAVALAAGLSAETTNLDRTAFEAYVRHLFLWGPQVAVKVGEPKPSGLPGFVDVTVTASSGEAKQEETFLVGPGGKFIRGTVYDLKKNPFAEDLGRIDTGDAPKFGPADAPLQLVIFSDFQCSFCRKNSLTLRQEVIPAFGKDLQIVYKDFPLDPIHPWARTAAVAGRCFYRQKPASFWSLQDWIFDHQDQFTAANFRPKALEFARTSGLDAGAITACMDAPATMSEVNRQMEEARTLGVNSTPTMFLNGRRLVGALPWSEMKEILTQELAYTRKAQAK